MPSAAYLLGASEAVVALAYERGHFTMANTVEVAKALRAYSVGLIFFGLVRVTAQVFYSFKDTATPVKISIAAVLTNIVLSLLFMGPLGFSGLALATSIAAIVNFSLLYKFSGKKLPRPDRFGLIKFSFLIGIPSLLCGLGAYWITRHFGAPMVSADCSIL